MSLLNISSSLYGRQVIYTSENEITADNVVKVLRDALTVHSINESRITYLENYYKGDQPILYRTKTVRAEIDNKTVENHALEIVEFMVSQQFGEPVQYVRRGKDESKSDDVQKLNDYMYIADKSYWDVELGRWQSMVGTAYRVCYLDNPKLANIENGTCPFGIDVPRPQDTFVVYSNKLGKKPLMGVYRTKDDNGICTYACYTKNRFFEIKDEKIQKQEVNGIGLIPIIEYPNNSRRLSDIEVVEGLLNGINKIQTNRLDGIEQFVQAFLVFINCQIDSEKYTALKEEGALAVFSEQGFQADVKLIAEALDQEQTQVAKDDLYNAVLTILSMPSREGNTGGDTGQAVYLRNGWDFAEKRAEINEEPVEKSEKEFLKVALQILTTNQLLNLNINDIEIKFTRSKTDNMVVKTQALLQQLQAGIDPQIALKTCGLYSDPEDVYLKSAAVMIAKYGMASVNQPEPQSTQPLTA